ncbi:MULTISPECIES: hypothetical protein [Terrilactibacillus]|uniref:Uncharacterized protein n=2 Tax=Terrilactibacillus TaxID=1795633 RepID=A0A6N8CTY1_9BACI|nr:MULTISPECIES: hypothetical protein [Terrilactibacillus]MTT32717.1 hypothetical protein [Terrilactibacillus tamarindi]
MDIILNMLNDSTIYIATITLFIVLSINFTSVFLSHYYNSDSVKKERWIYTNYLVKKSVQDQVMPINVFIHWVAKHIRRKERPNDDSTDHCGLLIS